MALEATEISKIIKERIDNFEQVNQAKNE